MFIKKLCLSLIILLNLGLSDSWAGRAKFNYTPSGEESEELLTAVHELNANHMHTCLRGYVKIEDLSEQGDWNAFKIICHIKNESQDKSDYISYINHIYLILSEQENYSTLGLCGKILSDMNDYFNALPFLTATWEHRQQFQFSLEDLDYNYISVLCNIDPKIINDPIKFSEYYKKAWEISKSYLNRKDNDYKMLFGMLFYQLKIHNQERLINEIGHFIYNSDDKHYWKAYNNVFKDSLHLERLFRQRNVVAVEGNGGFIMNDGLADKKAREQRFIENSCKEIREIVAQELSKILATEDVPQQDLKNFGVEKIHQLDPEQKNIFGRYLIHGFVDRLFPTTSINMDIEEYMEKHIPAKSDKQNFLVEQVLSQFKN
ncbi:MAG: hypothetical protein ACRYGR_03065 [Janthinobacterium lividum]